MRRSDLMNKDLNYRNVKVIFSNGKTKKGILDYCYTTFDYFLKIGSKTSMKLDLRKVKSIESLHLHRNLSKLNDIK